MFLKRLINVSGGGFPNEAGNDRSALGASSISAGSTFNLLTKKYAALANRTFLGTCSSLPNICSLKPHQPNKARQG
jgi:hypothetical protein